MAPTDTPGPLAKYWSKRDFSVSSEPRGERVAPRDTPCFVIQKHAASHLHYDFRLELDGVLVSWAVPKGPSLDPSVKRMAIRVEDHPLSYASFEGTIPPKQYGAGSVLVWDNGTWEPIGDAQAGLMKGKLAFRLRGQKLAGLWELIRIAKGGEKQPPWLLFKKRDEFARLATDFDVVSALPDSVISKPLAAAPARTQSSRLPSKVPRVGRGSRVGRAQQVSGALKAAQPAMIAPQLATLATAAPTTGQWSYEIKFDGYRIMARIVKRKVTLYTRGGHDWTDRMPGLVTELAALGLGSAWLDGEIVVAGAGGIPDFNALQKAFDRRDAHVTVDYFLFDVPYLDGFDLRAVALADRRKMLKALLDDKPSEHLRFSADFEADPGSILRSACRMNLEGVIAKRLDARYVSRRTDTWLKLKCRQRQEFVVCGYTDRSDGSPEIGSLLLGVHGDDGALRSVGRVGTGWDRDEASALKRRLAKIDVRSPPFAAGTAKSGRWSRRVAGTERWVQPKLVAEVEFTEWTPDGQIRHASYMGLRADKPARSITRERAKVTLDAGPLPVESGDAVRGVKVTHGERVIDPGSGRTKLDMVRYYDSIADWILPHLAGRPCALVRAPEGVTGEQFFQKHGERIGIPGITELPASLWPDHGALLEVANATALVGCAQMNVIELHTWNSKKNGIGAPDRMIFDLDPGEGTPWAHVQEAALLMRAFLTQLELEAWVKTSGGKGLHVVVPLTPSLDYETVKAFSRAIVQHLAKTIPSRFVAKSGAANRIGKLFVDYLRNGLGSTTASAFSARARPGLGVSMPIAWDDIPNLKGAAHWNIATARDYVSLQTTDPWTAYWAKKQTLTAGMKRLGFKHSSRES